MLFAIAVLFYQEVVFLAGAFLAGAFFAGSLVAVDTLTVTFLAVVFFAGAFFAAVLGLTSSWAINNSAFNQCSMS